MDIIVDEQPAGPVLDLLLSFTVALEEFVSDNSQHNNHDHELLEVHFAVPVCIQALEDLVDLLLIPAGLNRNERYRKCSHFLS